MELRLKFLDNKLIEEWLSKAHSKLNEREKLDVTKLIYSFSLREKELVVDFNELVSFLQNKTSGAKIVSSEAPKPRVEISNDERFNKFVEEEPIEEEVEEESYELEDEKPAPKKGRPSNPINEDIDVIEENRVKKVKQQEYNF